MENIKSLLQNADSVLIGAGAGLSTSAGFTYSGSRFQKYFADFEKKYGFHDMYSGGFYPYKTLEENWAYWSRQIYLNRFVKAPLPVYEKLFELVKNKNYFVLTTNVDHCFQKAGFDKSRLFYTQGDYGLWQCSEPCHKKTYDNQLFVEKMVREQGFVIHDDGGLELPENGFGGIKMTVPSELVPRCKACGKPMSMNLRADDTFVEDEGWNKAAGRYEDFLNKNKDDRIVFLELGVGGNTPGIIKYPFWKMTYANPKAVYVCINKGEAEVPGEIENQSICVNNDIYETLADLR
ncbi:Sir2 silent information regulator family NAD-dependent deacetylase [Treponema ruminis]|uniref:NAD-dependent SIR2 family protein deacetylase n=1 Tax=Treponema ruminis TaxID=744515 RepID=A0A7W8LMT8_9SPIR|nr:Sir2 silent information regulator family NAD-dependent deacetylase [Treponema ruminis]MBB5226745.1 NAD-dependent SIR2 family protein deacetylase [Treponema ruminis]QSI02033.1 Sir2 silent information regulator family NAD-dependent deacetylase [Treponema ruminis]